MKWEAQSGEEMGKKYYPLMGPGGGDELSLVGEPMRDMLDKYPALRSFWMCPSMTEEAIHLPPAPDIVGEG